MRKSHIACFNCKRDWWDDLHIPLKECPYCGTTEISVLNKKERHKKRDSLKQEAS